MWRNISFALWIVITICTTGLAQSPVRHPVPSEAELTGATKLVADAYKKEYTAAKSSAQKQALARKLLADAEQTKDDVVARYAVLQVARKIAVGIADIELAMQIVDSTTKHYKLDDGEARSQVLNEISSAVKSPADVEAFLRHVRRALYASVKKNQFDQAQRLAELSLNKASLTRDAQLTKEWNRRSKEVNDQANEYEGVKHALEKLATSASDPDANGTVGKYMCFLQSDWGNGLSMLALSNDKVLQPLAEHELKQDLKPTAMADAWNAAATGLPEVLQTGALRRVEYWYRKALPTASGLEQRRLQQKIQELTPRTTFFHVNEWEELLDFVDPAKHAFNTQIRREGNSIVIQDHRDQGYFTVPVTATGSYELRVRALWVNERDEGIGIRLPGNNGACYFLNAYSGTVSGIGQVGGKDVNVNTSKVPGIPQPQGVPYEVHIRMERKGENRVISAALNGRKYSRFQTPVADLESLSSLPWHHDQFGISDWWKVLHVQSIELKVLDGTASLTE